MARCGMYDDYPMRHPAERSSLPTAVLLHPGRNKTAGANRLSMTHADLSLNHEIAILVPCILAECPSLNLAVSECATKGTEAVSL